MVKPLKQWGRRDWWAALSFTISLVALFLPYVLVYTTDAVGFLIFYPVTIVMGIVSGTIAYFLKSEKLLLFAMIAGLSPLLVFFGSMFGAQIVYVITGGRVVWI
ncbi:MAG: hypothetical protein Q4A82_07705 [Corynebacterium sp.]|nr:hypothetical protein [Corynebacterium sp.]